MADAQTTRTVLLTCDFEAAYIKHVAFEGYRTHSAPAMARVLTERGLPMSWLIQLEREDLYLNVDYFHDRIAPLLRWEDGHTVELHVHFNFGPNEDDTVRENRLRLLDRGVAMLERHGYDAEALRPGPTGSTSRTLARSPTGALRCSPARTEVSTGSQPPPLSRIRPTT